jgi:phosphoketolase
MTVMNDLDASTSLATWSTGCPQLGGPGRLRQAGDARQADRPPQLHHPKHGEDMPEIRDWKWIPRVPE